MAYYKLVQADSAIRATSAQMGNRRGESAGEERESVRYDSYYYCYADGCYCSCGFQAEAEAE